MRALLVPIIATTAFTLGWASPTLADGNRFKVHGDLERANPGVVAGRYSLKADLTRAPASAQYGPGLRLVGSLVPSGVGLCTPDLIFANGFQ